ncbi:hypothetical protein V6U78_12395 [Marinospirillum sp. MEB164]|uniref:Uncharacterized protein n=1 Tax=Marinospirillum alkalitolerans TaxID=3123374 RepID=A0ABW8PZV9_9GAMM
MEHKKYGPADQVNWVEAIAVGGFYFERALYLGLPNPPAAFVFEDDFERIDEVVKIIGLYHTLFAEAEAQAAGFRKAGNCR